MTWKISARDAPVFAMYARALVGLLNEPYYGEGAERVQTWPEFKRTYARLQRLRSRDPGGDLRL